MHVQLIFQMSYVVLYHSEYKIVSLIQSNAFLLNRFKLHAKLSSINFLQFDKVLYNKARTLFLYIFLYCKLDYVPVSVNSFLETQDNLK